VKKIYKFIKKIVSQKIYRTLVIRKAKSVGANLHVNYFSNVSKNTILGNNVNFNGMSINGGNAKITIGNNFHSGHDCQIIARFHNYKSEKLIPYDETFIEKDIIIEDNVWLGNNVIILGGVLIGEGAIIQAGSVVTKSIPKYALAGGHPAAVFKYRDNEVYEKLKKEQKFY